MLPLFLGHNQAHFFYATTTTDPLFFKWKLLPLYPTVRNENHRNKGSGRDNSIDPGLMEPEIAGI